MSNQHVLLEPQREGEGEYPRVAQKKIEHQRPFIREPDRVVQNETQSGMYDGNSAELDLSLCARAEQPSQFVHCLIVRMELAKARADIPVGRLIGRNENIENVRAFVNESS